MNIHAIEQKIIDVLDYFPVLSTMKVIVEWGYRVVKACSGDAVTTKVAQVTAIPLQQSRSVESQSQPHIWKPLAPLKEAWPRDLCKFVPVIGNIILVYLDACHAHSHKPVDQEGVSNAPVVSRTLEQSPVIPVVTVAETPIPDAMVSSAQAAQTTSAEVVEESTNETAGRVEGKAPAGIPEQPQKAPEQPQKAPQQTRKMPEQTRKTPEQPQEMSEEQKKLAVRKKYTMSIPVEEQFQEFITLHPEAVAPDREAFVRTMDTIVSEDSARASKSLLELGASFLKSEEKRFIDLGIEYLRLLARDYSAEMEEAVRCLGTYYAQNNRSDEALELYTQLIMVRQLAYPREDTMEWFKEISSKASSAVTSKLPLLLSQLEERLAFNKVLLQLSIDDICSGVAKVERRRDVPAYYRNRDYLKKLIRDIVMSPLKHDYIDLANIISVLFEGEKNQSTIIGAACLDLLIKQNLLPDRVGHTNPKEAFALLLKNYNERRD